MKDEAKTKKQLIAELEEMRQQRAVEKASERIREEVLAMRSSDDLLRVVFSMFREIGKLGVPAVACAFHFVNEETDRIRVYTVADHPRKYGISVPPQSILNLQTAGIDETEDYSFGECVVDGDIIGGVSGGSISSFLTLISSVPADFVERWRAGEVWSHREVASETKYMKQMLGKYPELKECPFYHDGIVTHVSFPHGTVSIKEKEEDHSEEHITIVQELTEALSLGYLRFLDFQKVESQLMQASRERAEERLRAEVMAMRSSDDMLKVVALMWQELVQMGFSMISCGIAFLDKAPDQTIQYWAAENFRKVGLSWTSPDIIEFNEDIVVCCDRFLGPHFHYSFPLEEYLARWKKGKVWFFEMTPEIYEKTKERFVKRWGLSGDFPWEMSEINMTWVPFTYGFVYIRSHKLSEEHIAIVQEFTEALSLGYLRFLDFQQLEEQTEQLKRERAVERVRAETSSMRQSADIGKVLFALMEEVRKMGVRLGDCTINIEDENAGVLQIYHLIPAADWREDIFSRETLILENAVEGMHLRSADVPLETARKWGWAMAGPEPVFWKATEDFPDQLRQFWKYRCDASAWEQVREHLREVLRGSNAWCVPFAYGGLFFEAESGVEFGPEELGLLEPFAEPMSLGYTRFLDLQRLEEQAEQARRERAVERVRAETLSMRKSDDLLKVVGVILQELIYLGIDIEASLINFVDEERQLVRSYRAFINPKKAGISWTSADLVEINEDVVAISRETSYGNLTEGWVDNWSSGKMWTTEYTAEDWENYSKTMADRCGLDAPFPFSARDVLFIDVPFAYGTIGVPVPQFSEEYADIIRAFTEALSLGYLRFLDFQKVDEVQRQLIDELEEELQTAHDMQMRLMPTESPQIAGFDIAGRCLPANHVGGDLFQYFPQDGKLAISLADVTGHAMEAAIPMVMFSGILKSEMRRGNILEQVFQDLNQTLFETLEKRTFVCVVIGELNLSSRNLLLSNSGCPYPYHFHAATGQFEELPLDAYPLAVQSPIRYPVLETHLELGDYVVFCSDGIAEAENATGAIFSFERTAETIRQGCSEGLSAEALIDHLIGTVKAFAGDAPQGDDMTCVVLKVDETG